MSKSYKRTSGYKRWIRRRVYLAKIVSGIAHLPGRKYRMQHDGWRRVS